MHRAKPAISGHVWKVNVGRASLDALLQFTRIERSLRVFLTGNSDPWLNTVSDEDVHRLFAMVSLCPHHVFQICTEHPSRQRLYMEHSRSRSRINEAAIGLSNASKVFRRLYTTTMFQWPMPNVIVGTSVDYVSQRQRITHLKETPAVAKYLVVGHRIETPARFDTDGVDLVVHRKPPQKPQQEGSAAECRVEQRASRELVAISNSPTPFAPRLDTPSLRLPA